jgi:hypothetical protein
MDPGETKLIVFEVLVTDILPDMTIIYNNACVEGDRPDLDQNNNCVELATTVRSFADLWVNKTSDKDEYLSGMPMRFDVEVRNYGPHIAVSAVLTDVLVGNAKFYAAVTPQGVSCDHDAGVITCDLGHLPPYTHEYGFPSIKLTFYAWAADEGIWVNRAEVDSLSFDVNTVDNQSGATYTVINELLVYSLCFNDGNVFNDDLANWSKLQGDAPLATSVTPEGARTFLGDFGKRFDDSDTDLIQFSMSGLPEHKRVRLEFTFFAIRSWDGNTVIDPWDKFTVIGKDNFGIWNMGPVEEAVFHSTFSNWNVTDNFGNPLYFQSYPAQSPVEAYEPQASNLRSVDYTLAPEAVTNNPPFYGAAEVGTLGYSYRQVANMNSVYEIGYRDRYDQNASLNPLVVYEHTSSELDLKVGAPNMQFGIDDDDNPATPIVKDESWGLECFNVYVQGTDLVYHLLLPLIVR